MNAVEIYEKASWDLEHNKITLGEYEERIKPLHDVVKVVRCKDCKHCEKRRTANYQPFFYCLMQECSIKDNDYCGYAERKTNNE